ncbi:aKG-HExxH-type peptide beta-hydroxylase [Streptomyces sp. NPDC057403]|uniref:aKG-HExxH-type peptide beta-hydroxylase n=1 Tax=Streptomyces sp. NPDC057403 TaxID=3346119 RepID=UPI0036BE079E
MTLPVVPDRILAELGRTGGAPETLNLLVRHQNTRQMLALRAVLDAAEAADPTLCPPGWKARLREDWALLAEADRAATPSPARARLLYPLTNAWAWHCLRTLSGRRPVTAERRRRLGRDLAHFGALAAAAAVRAGLPFTVRLTAYDGVLTLPSLGALSTADPGDSDVELVHRRGLTLRQHNAGDVRVHPEADFGAWSGALAWTPAHALPGLLPDAPPVPLDDLDPHRAARPPRGGSSLGGPVTLDDSGRKQWAQVWSGTAEALRRGGEHRVAETLALLRCLVPLAPPPGSATHGSCSASLGEAFGALLSSVPPDPAALASTLVHELHHSKLSALATMVTLHQATLERRYFAPWKPDPRPYDSLLQGAYAHLAVADYQQRRALADPIHGDAAWTQHARCHAMVGAVLPALVGSPDLTARGRLFVDAMVSAYERMTEHPAPRGHRARAEAYVRAARMLFRQRHASALRRPNE